MRDVEIINEGQTIRFFKKLWHPSELLLAKCFSFVISSDNTEIFANISSTSKKAIYEFTRLSFKNFSESMHDESRRNEFYSSLDAFYEKRNSSIDVFMRKKLPYYNLLFKHQKEAVYETFFGKNYFLAYEMGLGKSLAAATISRVHGLPRTLIACPAAVKWNWFRDLSKFGFNEIYFTMFDAAKRRTFRALQERFVIANYDIIGKFSDEILSSKVDHFILDECHGLKNHLTARTKNIAKIIEANPEARITFLSGTPIANRVNDVFSYLKLIGHELGSNHKKFLDEYTIQSSNRGGSRVTGGRNLQDLHVKLSNFMIRRTKDECLDLPEKIYLNYRYELDDYREEYNKIIKELSENKHLSALSSNLHSLNIITSKAKIKGIIEIANTIIGEGRKVVIFGGYKEPLNELEKAFGNLCVKIDGSVDSFTRDQHVQKFINDPECMVFLGNYDAAGVGINLVNSSDVIFINFPFTPAKLYQAIDRLHRIGATRSVNIHYTFCDDSIDEYIYDLIVDKEIDINVVIDQGKEVMIKENMIEILIKKLLKRDDIVFENPFHKIKVDAPVVSVEAEDAVHDNNSTEVIHKNTHKESIIQPPPGFE